MSDKEILTDKYFGVLINCNGTLPSHVEQLLRDDRVALRAEVKRLERENKRLLKVVGRRIPD